jgi:metal-responsive CopG/Arc/MetJ family transcriptional regulator
MNTGIVRLNITLSKDLVLAMNSIAGKRGRSRFIRDAVRESIEKRKKMDLEKLLAEGYRERYKEGIELTKEFEGADLEVWDEY